MDNNVKKPTKTTSSAKKTSTNKQQSRDRLFLVIIALVVIVCVIVGIVVLTKKDDNETNKNNGNNENNGDEYVDNSVGIIDMYNTENATVANGVKSNTSSKLRETKYVGDLEITDIDLKAENGMSTFTATVKNNSLDDFKSRRIMIKFTDKSGALYASLEGIIGDVSAGDTTIIDASTTADVVNAYDFSIELLEEVVYE